MSCQQLCQRSTGCHNNIAEKALSIVVCDTWTEQNRVRQIYTRLIAVPFLVACLPRHSKLGIASRRTACKYLSLFSLWAYLAVRTLTSQLESYPSLQLVGESQSWKRRNARAVKRGPKPARGANSQGASRASSFFWPASVPGDRSG